MNIGLIGLKGHHSVVLAGARQLGDCRIVAVSDDDPRALAEMKKREPLAANAELYADWRHLIEHTLMDACIVCDENGKRAEQLIELARRGIDVVSEKPLATSLADLRRVSEALAASKSRLTMLLTMRHDAKYSTMRKLIREGAVGQVQLATSQKSYRWGERDDWQKSRQRLGGTIPFIGIHSLDLIWWTTGLSFTRVAAFHTAGSLIDRGETEDSASILLELSNGGSATARLDYLRPPSAPTHGDDRLRVAGTKGIIEIAHPHEELSLMTSDKEPAWIKPEPTENLFVDFVKSLREGRPSRIPAADCLYITEVLLQARDAADERKMISLSGE